MEIAQVIASGQTASGNTITVTDRTRKWMFSAVAAATVVLDGKYTIYLPASAPQYVTVEGNYQTATIGTSTVSYIVFG